MVVSLNITATNNNTHNNNPLGENVKKTTMNWVVFSSVEQLYNICHKKFN